MTTTNAQENATGNEIAYSDVDEKSRVTNDSGGSANLWIQFTLCPEGASRLYPWLQIELFEREGALPPKWKSIFCFPFFFSLSFKERVPYIYISQKLIPTEMSSTASCTQRYLCMTVASASGSWLDFVLSFLFPIRRCRVGREDQQAIAFCSSSFFLCGFYPVFTPMSLGFHPLFFPWSSSRLISRLYTRREKRNDSGNRSSPTGKWVNKKKVFTIPPHWHIGQQVIICSFSSYFLTCPSLADVCAHTHNNLSWGDDESSHSRRRSKKNGIDSQERGLFQSHRVRSSLSNCRFSFCVLKARDPGTELEHLAHWKSHIIASVGVVRAAHFHHPTL